MKIQTTNLFLVGATAAGFLLSPTNGFRDSTQKKNAHRSLAGDDSGDKICTVDHDAAQSATEVNVKLETYPSEGSGLFKITISTPPFGTEDSPVSTFGWCIDYDRYIDKGDWSMDIFSAYDSDIHADAVDHRDMYPNLAYLINNINVGDEWPASDTCAGGVVTWNELQGGVWMLIDDKNGEGTWWEEERINCISEEIAEYARQNGNDYELDCNDPFEQVPLVLVSDDSAGVIQNQVIISETNVHSIPGLCTCEEPSEAPTAPTPRTLPPATAPSKTPSPTPSPTPEPGPNPAPPKNGSSSGDPHFKTWTGDKYDYHGECDLVLVDNPTFMDGKGLRVHIRTTRVKYFSYIEKVAVQIGEDVLEFDNDVEKFLINGEVAQANQKHHKTLLGGFVVRRDPKALSIRLADNGSSKSHGHKGAKIDLHTRKNGFPAVIVDGGHTDAFKGSLGLLGDWETGKRLARDGKTVLDGEDATDFALEWQVRDTEPMLFKDSRFPQYPTKCTPPAKMPKRLGTSLMEKEAEEACDSWRTEDKEDCIFDVMATRDVLVAQEGHIVHIE